MTPRRSRAFGPYKLLDRVASGGMAEVHRAWRDDGHGGRDVVAIKVVLPHCNNDEEFLDMMREEAIITSLLRHPNVASTYEWGEVDGQHYLAMEHVDGTDLRALLALCRDLHEPPPIEHVIQVIIDVLRGLHAAHTATDEHGEPLRIVHRDVSPSNVLIAFDGSVKVCDFGIAKAAFSQDRTRAGVVKGKVRYMSPEQTLGRRLDARSDVFAAAVLLYEGLTMRAAFGGEAEAETMELIRTETPPPPSEVGLGVPPEADPVVAKALAKRPEARYQTAREFAEALQALLDDRWPMATQDDLGDFVRRLFANELETGRRVIAEYEAGERLAEGAPTDVVAPVPDQPPEPRRLTDRLKGVLGGRRAGGARRGAARPRGAAAGRDTGPGAPSFEPGRADAAAADDGPTAPGAGDADEADATEVTAPLPPELA